MVRVSEPLRRLLDPAPEPHRAAGYWSLICGPEIRRVTKVLEVQRGRVRIRVEEERWASALEELRPELRRRMNRLSRGAYRDLEFDPVP